MVVERRGRRSKKKKQEKEALRWFGESIKRLTQDIDQTEGKEGKERKGIRESTLKKRK